SGPLSSIDFALKYDINNHHTDGVDVTVLTDFQNGPATNPVLVNGFANVTVSNLDPSNTVLSTFTAGTQPSLVAGTKYWVTLKGHFSDSAIPWYSSNFATGLRKTLNGGTWEPY